ncbi:MAG: nucleotidyltransferase domain-containing protein [Ornithinimicrobium sp.]
MTVESVHRRVADAIPVLRRHGAVFAYLHGSQADGTARTDSDVDIAAYFAEPVPHAFEVALGEDVDLLVLNHAPLEIRGRVALDGDLLFEDCRDDRVYWEAMTRKIYLDELPRLNRAHREFLEAVAHG